MGDVDSSITDLEKGKADNVAMTGATSSAAEKTGLVPVPKLEDREKFLCGDGTWRTPSAFADDAVSDETIEAFAASGIDITEG